MNSLQNLRWVALWVRFDHEQLPQTARAALSALDAAEREQLSRSGPNGAPRSMIGRFVLRRFLGRCLDQQPLPAVFPVSAGGKPLPLGGRCHYNLSHSGGSVLVAASLSPVGVDIEDVCCWPERLDRSRRAPKAICELAPGSALVDRERDFTERWVVGEACIKAADLRLADVGRVRVGPGRAGRWGSLTWELLPLPGSSTAAVATSSRRPNPALLLTGSVALHGGEISLEISGERSIE